MNSHLGMSILSEILLTSQSFWLIIDKTKNLTGNVDPGMKITWHWVQPHEIKSWLIYYMKNLGSIWKPWAADNTWQKAERGSQGGGTWSSVGPGVLSALVSKEAGYESLKDKTDSEEWHTILEAFAWCIKEVFLTSYQQPRKQRGIRVKPKTILPPPLNLPIRGQESLVKNILTLQYPCTSSSE